MNESVEVKETIAKEITKKAGIGPAYETGSGNVVVDMDDYNYIEIAVGEDVIYASIRVSLVIPAYAKMKQRTYKIDMNDKNCIDIAATKVLELVGLFKNIRDGVLDPEGAEYA